MRCPYCGSEDTRVSDSRPVEENNSIRRRRVCDVCKRRFTTYEKIETIPMVVIKKDNNREPYDREKIEGGILRACHKRPVSINQRFLTARRRRSPAPRSENWSSSVSTAWIRSPMSVLLLSTGNSRMSGHLWMSSESCSNRRISGERKNKV